MPFACSSRARASLWSPIFRCTPRRTQQGTNVRGGDTRVEVQVRSGVGHLLSEMVSGVEELVRSDMRSAVTTEAQSRCPAIRTSTRRGGADGRSTSFISLRRSAHASLRRGVRRRRRPSGEVVLSAPDAAVVTGLRGDRSGKFGYPFLPRIVPLVAGVNGAHHQHVDLSVELHAPGRCRSARRGVPQPLVSHVQMVSRYSRKMEFICESAMMGSAARSSVLRQ